MYRRIYSYVDIVEGTHGYICARALRALKQEGDDDLIEEFRSFLEERRDNQDLIVTPDGYIKDVLILGKIATISGQVDVAIDCASLAKIFRDNFDTLARVLRDVKRAEVHRGLCENYYNN